jgi:hypothetical protein
MDNSKIEHFEDKGTFHWIKFYLICVLQVVLTLIAGKLSWECSANVRLATRTFYTVISGIFSELYIVYYAIYRVFMGNKCM